MARGLTPKHAIKQVDRLLSNPGIDMDALLRLWVRYIGGDSQAIAVALDWTDFDADKQSTLMLSLITNQGRATPLYWLSVDKRTLKDRRNDLEYQLLVRFADALDPKVKMRPVADRGFGDQKLYRLLSEELNFNFVIRFRGNISVTAQDGETRTAAGWVTASGRARTLPNAAVTAQNYALGAVVCIKDKGMKQAWCLATNDPDAKPRDLIALYGGSKEACRELCAKWGW